MSSLCKRGFKKCVRDANAFICSDEVLTNLYPIVDTFSGPTTPAWLAAVIIAVIDRVFILSVCIKQIFAMVSE